MFLFANLAQLADQLAAEPSRLKKRVAIATAIRSITGIAKPPGAPDLSHSKIGVPLPPVLDPHDLADAGLFCLYLAGQPFPEADPRKLNAGGALLTRALKQVSHCTDAALTAAYRRHGDLGAAAHDLLMQSLKGTGFSPSIPDSKNKGASAPEEPSLTLDELSNAFDQLAAARTTASRSATVVSLLQRTTPLEAKYLLKLMLGDMRIGVKQSLIEEAIAAAASHRAHTITPAAVRHAVMLQADLARTVLMAFTGALADARMTLFHPLGFMLASPVDTPEEAVLRFTVKPEKPPKPTRKTRRKKGDPNTDTETEDIAEAFPDLTPTESLEPAPIYQEIASEAGVAAGFSPLKDAAKRGASALGSLAKVHAFLEDKCDGMRAQLHCGDPAQPNRVTLYSRNREDITASFPELTEAFANVTTPLILDGEILGWDLTTNRALPFATLGQRIGRKRIDDDLRRQVPVIFMAFDLLFQNGDLLLNHPLRDRRTRLEKLVADLAPFTTSTIDARETIPKPQFNLFESVNCTTEIAIPRLLLSPARLVESAQAIDQAYTDARARSNEGVMLKSAESTYQPGRRGLAWVKLKRELATLDVVITGAEYGHGKRAGLLSDYTFAIRNKTGDLLNVGKAYSGLTDAEILSLTAWLKAHTLEDHGHFRTVEPLQVIEIAFNNIMRSSRHTSGFALRFPRILRLRNDKPLDEIDTLERVEEIYQSQPDRPTEEAL